MEHQQQQTRAGQKRKLIPPWKYLLHSPKEQELIPPWRFLTSASTFAEKTAKRASFKKSKAVRAHGGEKEKLLIPPSSFLPTGGEKIPLVSSQQAIAMEMTSTEWEECTDCMNIFLVRRNSGGIGERLCMYTYECSCQMQIEQEGALTKRRTNNDEWDDMTFEDDPFTFN